MTEPKKRKKKYKKSKNSREKENNKPKKLVYATCENQPPDPKEINKKKSLEILSKIKKGNPNYPPPNYP